MKHSSLDHICIKNVKDFNPKIEAGVLQTNYTYHFSTILSTKIKEKKEIVKSIVKVINYKKLNETFKKEIWSDVMNPNDVNICVSFFK